MPSEAPEVEKVDVEFYKNAIDGFLIGCGLSIDFLKKLSKKKSKTGPAETDRESRIWEADSESGSESETDINDLDHQRGVILTADGKNLTSGRFYNHWRRSSSFDQDVKFVIKNEGERNARLEAKLAQIEDDEENDEESRKWSKLANPSHSVFAAKDQEIDDDENEIKSKKSDNEYKIEEENMLPKEKSASGSTSSPKTPNKSTTEPTDDEKFYETEVLRIKEKYATEVNEDQIEECMEIFKSVDIDGNGRIERDELQIAFSKTLGRQATDLEVENMFNTVDMNDDGKISFDEYFSIIHVTLHADREMQKLIEAFEVFDAIETHKVMKQDGLRDKDNGYRTHRDFISTDNLKYILGDTADFEESVESFCDRAGEFNYRKFARRLIEQRTMKSFAA